MRRPASIALTWLALFFAAGCESPPPRTPASDPKPAPLTNTCSRPTDWCQYDAQCCSGRCESEMSMCR